VHRQGGIGRTLTIEAKPENLIGDRAYDSDPLDAELRKDGIEMIAPHRSNRSKPPTQDRRRLSRYMRRWLVERFFAWIQWQRRILVRWEHHAQFPRLCPACLPRYPLQTILR
jgi:transposase